MTIRWPVSGVKPEREMNQLRYPTRQGHKAVVVHAFATAEIPET